MSDWKPDADTLKSWGTSSHWPKPYFEWLRAQGKLPQKPVATAIIFAGLVDVLHELHQAPAENIEAFFAGRFSSPYEVESHNMAWDRPSENEVKTIVQEMLLWKGELSNEVVDAFFEKITTAALHYGAPRA